MWLLLIEDEARLADALRRGLEEEGYTVDVAADAPEGERRALAHAYDALVVDWRLPGGDGRTIVERVRAAGSAVPILMLTALDDVEHRVAGLDAGADDYLAKPFAFEELLARLRALARRPPRLADAARLDAGPLRLDATRRRVTVERAHDGGTERGEPLLLNLRPKEYDLLELLLRHAGATLARAVIAERVWGEAPYVTDNALDVTVSGLRQKLADALAEAHAERVPGAPRIETVRGVGYRLVTGDVPGGLAGEAP